MNVEHPDWRLPWSAGIHEFVAGIVFAQTAHAIQTRPSPVKYESGISVSVAGKASLGAKEAIKLRQRDKRGGTCAEPGTTLVSGMPDHDPIHVQRVDEGLTLGAGVSESEQRFDVQGETYLVEELCRQLYKCPE